jgi:hypothetical protein
MAATFLTAAWKNLIMANYIVDEAMLKPFVPHNTELDFFNGNSYVSLVGFMFANTKLMGVKIPYHVNFTEVNLRFYVKYNDNGQWKRGTVFISEIVPKPAISFIANTVYGEKYRTRKMNHFLHDTNTEMSLGYHWKHLNKFNKIEAVVDNSPLEMTPGSEAEFITEHYWGYSKYNDNTTFEYNVQHPAWKIFPMKSYLVDCDFAANYGAGFSALDRLEPNSVFVAAGSGVSVLRKRKL